MSYLDTSNHQRLFQDGFRRSDIFIKCANYKKTFHGKFCQQFYWRSLLRFISCKKTNKQKKPRAFSLDKGSTVSSS